MQDKTPTLHSLDVRQTTHEEVCIQFKKDVWKRLDRLESVIMTTAGLLIISMLGVIFAELWGKH